MTSASTLIPRRASTGRPTASPSSSPTSRRPAPMTGPRATSRSWTSGPARSSPWSTRGRAESSPFYSPDGAGSPTPPATTRRPGRSTPRLCRRQPRAARPASWPTPSTTAPTSWAGRRTARRLLFRENRGTTTRLYALPLDGEPQGFGPEDGVVAEASLNADPDRDRVQLPDGGPARRGIPRPSGPSRAGPGQPRQRRTARPAAGPDRGHSLEVRRTARRSRGC